MRPIDNRPVHLSDEDINKIANKVCGMIEARLYNNVGEGIVSLVWKGVIIIMLAIAAYASGFFHLYK